jgi:hypothetical protein
LVIALSINRLKADDHPLLTIQLTCQDAMFGTVTWPSMLSWTSPAAVLLASAHHNIRQLQRCVASVAGTQHSPQQQHKA